MNTSSSSSSSSSSSGVSSKSVINVNENHSGYTFSSKFTGGTNSFYKLKDHNISCDTSHNLITYYSNDVQSLNNKMLVSAQKKKYVGYNRLSRALRHVSSIVYHGAKDRFDLNLKEVQASVILGKLNLSANFHSELIPNILNDCMNYKSIAVDKNNNIKVERAASEVKIRLRRHKLYLYNKFLNSDVFESILRKGVEEIERGEGVPQDWKINKNSIVTQFKENMRIVFHSLNMVKSGQAHEVIIHHPPIEIASDDITTTRHAERNIVSFVCSNKDFIIDESLRLFGFTSKEPIIVSIEGRFVPCGVCYEQELIDKSPGGLFSPLKKDFLLHRSTLSAGLFYRKEKQILTWYSFDSDQKIARNKAHELLLNIYSRPEKLGGNTLALKKNTSLNTDSESSDDENESF